MPCYNKRAGREKSGIPGPLKTRQDTETGARERRQGRRALPVEQSAAEGRRRQTAAGHAYKIRSEQPPNKAPLTDKAADRPPPLRIICLPAHIKSDLCLCSRAADHVWEVFLPSAGRRARSKNLKQKAMPLNSPFPGMVFFMLCRLSQSLYCCRKSYTGCLFFSYMSLSPLSVSRPSSTSMAPDSSLTSSARRAPMFEPISAAMTAPLRMLP